MVTKKTTNTDTWAELSVVESLNSDFSLTNVLLIIVITLNALCLYFLTGNTFSVPGMILDPLGIKSALLDLEYDKVGGKQNYDLLTKAQQLSLQDPQNPSNLTAMKTYVESFGADGVKQPGTTTDTTTVPTTNTDNLTLAADKMAKVLEGASIQGNKDADIIVIEYSDMECPFCVRQYHETKLAPTLLAQYGDKVKFAFKNNRGVDHEGTEEKAIGALCAKKVGGDAAYVKFYTTVMDGTTQAGGVYDVAKLWDAAKAAGVDAQAWQSCYDAKETLATFSSETAEAQGFNLGGTPGTLILNVKTGKYATIEGAYPYQTFTQKIDSLMQE